MVRSFVISVCALFSAPAALPQTISFDPRAHKAEIAGPPTQILVLGTPHLSNLPESFKPGL